MVDETGEARRRESQVIGLVGGAFLVHHFLQLALPPPCFRCSRSSSRSVTRRSAVS